MVALGNTLIRSLLSKEYALISSQNSLSSGFVANLEYSSFIFGSAAFLRAFFKPFLSLPLWRFTSFE